MTSEEVFQFQNGFHDIMKGDGGLNLGGDELRWVSEGFVPGSACVSGPVGGTHLFSFRPQPQGSHWAQMSGMTVLPNFFPVTLA